MCLPGDVQMHTPSWGKLSQLLVADPVLALLIRIHHEVPALLELLLQRLLRWWGYQPRLCNRTASHEAWSGVLRPGREHTQQ